MCFNKVLFNKMFGFFFFLKYLSLKMDEIQAVGFPFVGSDKVFPYEWSNEGGSVNRNLTDGAFLS